MPRIRPALVLSRNVEKKCENLKLLLVRNSDQFCKKTILHGLKYVADRELHPLERLFFGLAFITVIVLAAIFVETIWDRWRNNPVIMGYNPYPSYITQEPFPAVTICNLNVAQQSRAKEFSIYSKKYAMLQLLCKRQVNISIVDKITDWSNLTNLLTKIAQPCNQMIISCHFGSIKYDCSELFHPVITDEGMCCAFNKLHPIFMYNSHPPADFNDSNHQHSSNRSVPVKWSVESGYQEHLPEYYEPRPAVGTGETLGLTLTLDVESNEYYCSSMNSIGFKILIHSPVKNPSLLEAGLLLAPGWETKALIKTVKYESDEKLRRIHPSYRQCYFENERILSVYSIYTESNCEFECFGKMLIKYCGCITHFMPKNFGNVSVCSIYDAKCVENMRLYARRKQYNVSDCAEDCLPSCHDISYLPKLYSAPLTYDGFRVFKRVFGNLSSDYIEQNIVLLHIYHDDADYRAFKQTMVFTGTDALSSFSGLISVFCGFGFMAFAELFYFGVVRLFRKARRHHQEIQPTWRRPVRKRFRNEIALSPYRRLFAKPTNESREFVKR